MKVINFLVLGIFLAGFVSAFSFSGWFVKSTENPLEEVNVSLDNFVEVFEDNPLLNDLPEEASIKLSIGEKDFFVGMGNVEEFNDQKVDVEVKLSEKYIGELSTKNYCETLKKSISAKDYDVSLKISKISFIWRYKKLIKYGRCFGF